jgi:hypothetical protein
MDTIQRLVTPDRPGASSYERPNFASASRCDFTFAKDLTYRKGTVRKLHVFHPPTRYRLR